MLEADGWWSSASRCWAICADRNGELYPTTGVCGRPGDISGAADSKSGLSEGVSRLSYDRLPFRGAGGGV